jgi:peptide-methionine (S)-S-oxide reductase
MIRLLSAISLSLGLLVAPAAADDPVKAAGATAIATFAAGCYWCVESDFDKVAGVLDTESGFMGGHTKNPTYEEVGTGETGHTEVVRVTYDPSVVSYSKLLAHFWRNVDPHDATGQFCDRGSQYRPAIFVYDDEQIRIATESKVALEKGGKLKEPIVVEILRASDFTPAKDQNFYKTNATRYKFYRAGCGRDARLAQIWGPVENH